MVELTLTERKNLAEYLAEEPAATVTEMKREARKPRIRRKIGVDLTKPMRSGLEKARKAYEMEAEEIAALAIEWWLEKEGFM